jgi:vacuolar-type H+-ATPase subunit E/Vma4
MGYQILIETLLKEGESKSREIVEKARKDAEAILQEAKEKADLFEKNRRQLVEKEIEFQRTKILNQGRMEARQILLKARHEVLEKVFERAKERVSQQLRQGGPKDLSRRFWNQLVEESLLEQRPEGLKAIVHEEASSDLERALREKGIRCERIRDPDLWLGFKLVMAEGKVVVTNSYKARLEKVRSDLLVALNALLYSN